MIKLKASHFGAIIKVEGDDPDVVSRQLTQAMRVVEEALDQDDEIGLDQAWDAGCPAGDEQGNDAPNLARYQSHKTLEAAKIVDLNVLENGQAELELYVDHDIFTLVTRPGWTQRFTGSTNDLGYYVVYPDGFTSWSPTRAFEEGNRRID